MTTCPRCGHEYDPHFFACAVKGCKKTRKENGYCKEHAEAMVSQVFPAPTPEEGSSDSGGEDAT